MIYSTAVQHGPNGGPAVIKEAIRRTDSTLKRTDRRYEAALIGNIYDRRTEIFVAVNRRYRKQAEQFLTSGDHKNDAEYAKRARNSGNIAVNRYPDERMQALLQKANDRDANNFRNIIKIRYPNERSEALYLLTKR